MYFFMCLRRLLQNYATESGEFFKSNEDTLELVPFQFHQFWISTFLEIQQNPI